ncbi:hypothetical protein KAI58_01070 [Candidatus Gracilibacteria bacterium]|nr:hypothetical protein [Candidatus Gracilibacteria bacterium]
MKTLIKNLFLKTKKAPKKELSFKKNGSVLLVTILLGGMILTIGTGAAKILIKEIQFSSDLLFAEKSYFAAESGVEIALFELKNEPIRHLVNQEIDLGNGTLTNLSIKNRVDSSENFIITLLKNESTKFRLSRQKTDSDNLLAPIINKEKVENFKITNSANKTFHWKVLCKDEVDNATVVIQGDTSSELNPSTSNGIFEDANGDFYENTNLAWFLQESNYKNCFLSVENLEREDTIYLSFQGVGEAMTSNKATISAIGLSGGREIHIAFDYAQKNLGTLFDFVFFHSNDGL